MCTHFIAVCWSGQRLVSWRESAITEARYSNCQAPLRHNCTSILPMYICHGHWCAFQVRRYGIREIESQGTWMFKWRFAISHFLPFILFINFVSVSIVINSSSRSGCSSSDSSSRSVIYSSNLIFILLYFYFIFIAYKIAAAAATVRHKGRHEAHNITGKFYLRGCTLNKLILSLSPSRKKNGHSILRSLFCIPLHSQCQTYFLQFTAYYNRFLKEPKKLAETGFTR